MSVNRFGTLSNTIIGPTGPTGAADYTIVQNAQTADYTLALSDANKLVEINSATSKKVTVPTNSSVAFPIGTQIDVLQVGDGQVTIEGASGVTVDSRGSALKISGKWGVATLVKRATNTWVAFGALTT